ncbi:MAG: hypothetical protein K2L89_03080, partial [Muribaculaceae bacterium]|nr:hypothetical protein [Muribaculaceae bacterium]
KLMQSEQDFKDYVRGLEENISNLTQMNDSSYMISYLLGAMEAVFMTDGMHHKKKDELPPFHCIVAGLRKVGEGHISLPSDTIAAMKIINRYTGDVNPFCDLSEDTKCDFFTAYGIMKAYQPGLQSYMDGMIPGTACEENRQAYANGMADVIEAYSEPPKTAYYMGRSIALSMCLNLPENHPIEYKSFVAGAKASLGLGEEIMPRGKVDEIFNRMIEETGAVDS